MLEELKKLLDSADFGKQVFADMYGEGYEDAYRKDKQKHDTAKAEAQRLLSLLRPSNEELYQASQDAFSGRLSWLADRWEYTAGQFYDLELPQAIRAVLEEVRRKRLSL